MNRKDKLVSAGCAAAVLLMLFPIFAADVRSVFEHLKLPKDKQQYADYIMGVSAELDKDNIGIEYSFDSGKYYAVLSVDMGRRRTNENRLRHVLDTVNEGLDEKYRRLCEESGDIMLAVKEAGGDTAGTALEMQLHYEPGLFRYVPVSVEYDPRENGSTMTVNDLLSVNDKSYIKRLYISGDNEPIHSLSGLNALEQLTLENCELDLNALSQLRSLKSFIMNGGTVSGTEVLDRLEGVSISIRSEVFAPAGKDGMAYRGFWYPEALKPEYLK